MKGLTQLNDPSTFPTESFLKFFCFVQSAFLGEEVLQVEGKRTFWNPIVNASVGTVDMSRIEEGILRCTSTARLLQD